LANDGSTFVYYLGVALHVCRIDFVGNINIDSIEELNKLEKDVKSTESQYFVINARDTQLISKEILPSIFNIIVAISSKHVEYFICGLNPELRILFLENNIVDELKIVGNTVDAFERFKIY